MTNDFSFIVVYPFRKRDVFETHNTHTRFFSRSIMMMICVKTRVCRENLKVILEFEIFCDVHEH